MIFADDGYDVPVFAIPDLPGTLWTLVHRTEGSVSVSVGSHPHGYELRLLLNQRFIRSRVHESLSAVLADATDTRSRFERLGFFELESSVFH
jgi:hypothetical protein